MGMQSFAIIFTPTPGSDVPPEIRLRRLLKSALRQHGLRCLDIRELPDAQAKIASKKSERKSK